MLHVQFALARIYEAILLIVMILGFIRYKKMDKSTRYICMWIALGVLTEATAKISVYHFKTNMLVYAVSCLIEFAIISLYFNQSIKRLKKRNLGIIIAGTGILLGILNIIFFQSLNSINSNFLFLECLGIVCFSFYALYQMLAAPDLQLRKETHFWFATTLLFYECVSLWNWGIYEYLIHSYKEKTVILNISFLISNIITYLSCGLLIYLYPKMRQTYV